MHIYIYIERERESKRALAPVPFDIIDQNNKLGYTWK